MKREYGAAAVLAVLLLLSCWSIRKVDGLTTELSITLEKSRSAAETLDSKRARELFEESLRLWLDAEQYTHIFIRHSEIDAITDAFYELSAVLDNDDRKERAAAFDKLRYHLDSVNSMEKPSLGSIF